MTSPNLTEIVTTTLRNREKEWFDNVTDNNALLTRLKQRGQIKPLDGGRTIVKPLMYAENGSFQYYSGYESLDISPTDMLTSAEFDWKQAATNVSINGLERRQNSGSNAFLDLLEARIKNSMNTMANNISVGLYSDGTGSGGKQIGGLQLLVADDPTTGTVGGIDRSAQTWWRNVAYDATTDGGAAASATNIQSYMNTVYNQLVRGADKTDLVLADNNYFGFFEDSLQANQRFTTSNLAELGFMSYKYKGADVVLENGSSFPANHMYFLNTDFIGLEVHKDANMTPMDEKVSINQDAFVIPVIWMGNMTVSNSSLQGVLKD